MPASADLLALAAPVEPTEVFRFAAPCAGTGCQPFDGADCRLAAKLVQLTPPAGRALPACRVRPDCRWWRQEGKAACFRCPEIVTHMRDYTDAQALAADPRAPDVLRGAAAAAKLGNLRPPAPLPCPSNAASSS